MISFDMGGQWELLNPPTVDYHGNPIQCNNGCSLHLAGLFEGGWYTQFYSVPGAIGIVFGAGNVGTQLSRRPEEWNTFMSRDAGYTWNEIAKGVNYYEIADLGSLIILATSYNVTDTILFSWNEGLNFTECRFTNVGGIDIENIITGSANWTSETVIIYGETVDKSGIIVHMDFSAMQPTCQNPQNAGKPGSDYELWSPVGNGGDDCQLGRKTVYTRKKQDVDCFNPNNYVALSSVAQCDCKREDYQCDFCYALGGDGVTCVPSCDVMPSAPQPCTGYYNQSQGYRLVVGDTCNYTNPNALNLLPVRTLCSSNSSRSSSSSSLSSLIVRANFAIIIVVGIVLIAAIALVVIVFVLKKKKVFERLRKGKDETEKGNYTPLSTLEDDESDEENNTNSKIHTIGDPDASS